MKIRCPNCQDGIELVNDSDFQSVDCPSCGSQFGLVDVEEDNIATLAPGDEVPEGAKRTGRSGKGMIAHFELVEEVGRGAFGSVWQALDTELDRTVAIKVPRPGQFSQSSREQFLREARAAAQLSHPNIVSIYEVGLDDDRVYIVSDFVDGISLADFLAKKRLAPRQAASFCIKVAGALEHAHQKGVIHRDLKPSNIMLAREGQPQVMDFGLAKREAGEVTMTIEGKLLGTPAYMPPEQARGEGHDVDRRADVYSLGVILYELLTGEIPFRGTTRMLLHQVMNDEAPSPRKLNNSIPRDLETICLKCLEKDPAKRYDSCEAFAKDLQSWIDHEPIQARPVGHFGRFNRWRKRKPAVAALSAAMVLILFVGSTASSYFAIDASRKAEMALVAKHTAEKNEVVAKDARKEAMDAKVSAEDERKKAEAAEMKADERADDAVEQRQLAILAEEKAKKNLELAEENAAKTRRLTYASDMLFAQRDWTVANIEHQRRLLQKHSDSDDLKSFEWNYLSRLAWSELMTLKGHSDDVNCTRFSPDGSHVASASSDGTVRIWNVGSGKEITKLTGHQGFVSSVCYSPDGQWIASASHDKTAKVWSVLDGKAQFTISGHKDVVTSVVYSSDGRWLLTGSNDNSMKIWNADDGSLVKEFPRQPNNIESVAFSSDGKMVVNGCNDKRVYVSDVKTTERLYEFAGHDADVNDVDFSPDGKFVVSCSNDNTVKIWNVITGEAGPRDSELDRTLVGHVGDVHEVRYSFEGDRICSCSADKTIRVWDSSSGRELLALKGHSTTVVSVDFSPDGKFIVSGSNDDTVRTWNADPAQVMKSLAVGRDAPPIAALSPDGNRLVSGFGKTKLRLWDTTNGKVVGEVNIPRGLQGVAFRPDGQRFATHNLGSNALTIWDVASPKNLLRFVAHDEIKINRFSQPAILGLSFSQGGRRLASVSVDGVVKEWDAEAGKLVREGRIDNKDPKTVFSSCAFSRDGRHIAWGGTDGSVRITEVATMKTVHILRGHDKKVLSVVFSQDSTLVASVEERETGIKIWDRASGELVRTIEGHAGLSVSKVVFAPDGKRLISAGFDGTVKLWDAENGQETLTLNTRKEDSSDVARIHDLSVNASGDRLAVVSKDGTVKVWDARPVEVGVQQTTSPLPGVDLGELSVAVKNVFIERSRKTMCPCGCKYNLVDCRIKDSECTVSRRLLNDLVDLCKKEKVTTAGDAAETIDRFFAERLPKKDR